MFRGRGADSRVVDPGGNGLDLVLNRQKEIGFFIMHIYDVSIPSINLETSTILFAFDDQK